MNAPRVFISGAGIAGLALARRLAQSRIEHVLIEKRSAAYHSSSGLGLPFNAIEALRELGLAERLLAVAHQVDEVIYAKKNGAVLARANLNMPPLNRDKFVAVSRGKLHHVLLEGVEERIHFDTTITSAVSQQDGVEVHCSNPALSGKYDLLVSAEGLRSSLRQQCFPAEATMVDHHMPNWRFLVACPKHGLQPTFMLDRTELFMIYPIGPDSLYCYAHLHDPAGRYSTGDPKAHLQAIFGGFGGQVGKMLALMDEKTLVCSRLESLAKPYFSQGRIVFMGDAGHACSPLLQQGAASAFEDAICLTTQLCNHPVEKAIAEYERIRTPRVAWVMKTSDDPIRLIKMTGNRVGALVRNMVVRKVGPLNALGWRKMAGE